MALSEINIYYYLPIICGEVQFPPNRETDKGKYTDIQALTLISGSAEHRLSMGSGHQYGSKQGAQEWIELPPITPQYTTNPGDSIAPLGGL